MQVPMLVLNSNGLRREITEMYTYVALKMHNYWILFFFIMCSID